MRSLKFLPFRYKVAFQRQFINIRPALTHARKSVLRLSLLIRLRARFWILKREIAVLRAKVWMVKHESAILRATAFCCKAGPLLVLYLETQDSILDHICLVIPPKTIPSPTLSPTRNIVYNPLHQDPTTRQPITEPDEFRVLVVESGSGDAEVCCKLINVASSWRTRYEALSYTWGDESIRETIIVNGLRTSVTKNLHSALVNLRFTQRQRVLWVDALCINQDDTEERDNQVQKMGTIYSKASRVIVWLGEQTEESRKAFSMIHKKWSKAFNRRYIRIFPEDNFSDDFEDGLKTTDWSPVYDLLRRPWFQRTWVIQEAVLPRYVTLACGPNTMSWVELSYCYNSRDFQKILPDDDEELAQGLSAVGLIGHGRYECHTVFASTPKPNGQWNIRKKHTPNFKLASTLYATRGFQCQDKRDKIFGILSIVTDLELKDKEILGPDYQASVETVYEKVAKWDITKNRSLELLSYCSRKEWEHPNLPSWVPDFSNIDEAYPILLLENLENRLESTSDDSGKLPGKSLPYPGPNVGFERGYGPLFSKDKDKTILTLSGEIVDTITQVGDIAENPRMASCTNTVKNPQDLVLLNVVAISKRRKWLRECARMAQSADPDSRHKAKYALDFWKSDIFDMSQRHYDRFSEAMGRHGSILNNYSKFLFENETIDAQGLQQWKGEHHWEEVDCYFRDLVHKRRFCIAQTGSMGWVPGATRQGDLVCRLSGAQVPMILRKVTGSGERDCYTIVGDAYFPDLMLRDSGESHYYVGGSRLTIV